MELPLFAGPAERRLAFALLITGGKRACGRSRDVGVTIPRRSHEAGRWPTAAADVWTSDGTQLAIPGLDRPAW